MKKRYLLVSLLASSFIVGLASCAGNENEITPTPSTSAPTESETTKPQATLASIAVSGQPTLFKKGSEFATTGLKVTATMSDGTTKDVTSEATVTQDVKMNEVGEYEVTVTYSNKTAKYKVSVLNPTGLVLDTTNCKKDYNRLEEVSLEGIKASLSYPTGLDNSETNLDDATIEVKLNDALDNELKKLGKHTVYVAKGEFIASFDINVNVEKLDENATPDDLIELANKYGFLATGGVYTDNPEKSYTYTKGNDLLIVTSEDKLLDPADDVTEVECNTNAYYTTYKGKPMGYTLSTAKADGRTIQLLPAIGSLKGKDDVNIFGNDNPVYGPEDALTNLLALYNERSESEKTFVKNGKANENGLYESYTITLDVENFDDADRREVRQISCTFVLSSSLYIEKLEVNGTYYTEMEKNPKTGKYPDIKDVTPHKIHVIYTQDDGEREAKMPYTIDELAVTSYKLMNGEEEIKNLGKLDVMLWDSVYLDFKDLKSEHASLSFDRPKFIVESDDPLVPSKAPENDLMFIQSLNKLVVTGYKIGEEEVTIKTLNNSFKFIINVIAPEPTEITPMYVDTQNPTWIQLFNIGDNFSWDLNKDLVLFGETTSGSDPRYEVELLGNVDPKDATLVQSTTKFDGQNNPTYTFNAKTLGDYKLKFTSLKNPNITTTVTIKAGQSETVEKLPQELLGSWVSNFNEVSIGESEINYDGMTQNIIEYIAGESFKTNDWTFTINADNTLSFNDGMSDQILTRASEETIAELPQDILGSYINVSDPTDVIIVTPTAIQIGDATYEFTSVEATEEGYTVGYGDMNKITLIYNDIEGHYFILGNDVYGIDPQTFPEVIVDNKYLGEFGLDNGESLLIEDKFITYNYTTERVYDFMDGGYIATRNFKINIDANGVLSLEYKNEVFNVVPDTVLEAVPEDAIGEYVNVENEADVITVAANQITISGTTYDITKIVDKNTLYRISYGEGLEIEIDVESGSPLIIYAEGFYKMKAPMITSLPEIVCGTYYNENTEAALSSVEVSATGIVIDGVTYELSEISGDESGYEASYDTNKLVIGYDFFQEFYYLVISINGEDNYFDLKEAPKPAVDIDVKYIGTYEIDGLFENIIININSIDYNFDTQNIIEYIAGESFRTEAMSFVIKTDGIYYVNENGEYKLNKLEAPAELPENILGEYVGEFNDALTLTVNPTSIVLNGNEYQIVEIAVDLSYFTYNNGEMDKTVYIENFGEIVLRDGKAGYIAKGSATKPEVPEAYIGTWEAAFGSNVVITATDVTYEEATEEIIEFNEADSYFYTNTWTFTINADGTLELSYGLNDPIILTKQEEKVGLDALFIGSYTNENDSEDKLELTADKIIFSATESYDIISIDEHGFTYNDGTKDVYVETTEYANGDICVGIGPVSYLKDVEKLPAVNIDESYVGSWEGNMFSVTISINSVDVDGDVEDIIEYVAGEYFKTRSYTFIINSLESLTIDTGMMQDELAPAQAVALDANLCGVYVSSTDNSKTIELTETEIIDGENRYEYIEAGNVNGQYFIFSDGIGNVVVEMTIAEDGSISFVLNDVTYVLTK